MVRLSVPLLLSLSVLAVVSVGSKAARYLRPADDGPAMAEALLTRHMTGQGYVSDGELTLVANGGLRALAFRKAGCGEPIYVQVISGSSQGWDLLANKLPPGTYDIHFEYRGELRRQPELNHFTAVETLSSVARSVGLPVPPLQPMAAVAVPQDCAQQAPTWPKILE